ncbi:PadR family transcriptional regulator [Longibaculum muris]|uniref:PadR family transcriptional regulator PadR n=1 Tax=Longibaculum muris TaxID=1796628 RepID=A0A4R3Z410_9FIRM|nr:PadR family transcriptional regulator [Longibaculum muris]KXU44352.1 transcriptional regulator, PadR family [Candidatus Stoquefichus sp. KLE1796]MCR1888525.1 PadR family transcriptional regulator [Longibaculum muris]MED9812580.1 PadR family transcriptional regulator [Longibaculum muris]TCV98623.1 PadR family transcriptional regulator PadR [Longibaculum muris]
MSKKNNFFRLEMLYLKILDEKDCYGYEITHTLKERTHGKINVKEGTMYPILYKFEEIGFITSKKKLVGKKMTRVYYHLEPSGKEYLDKIYSEYKDMVNVISDLMEGEYE